MLDRFSDKLSWAVLQTVAYSDIFDYPLTAREIYRYLTGVKGTPEEVTLALQDGILSQVGKYYTLPGREAIRDIRLQREKRSRELLPTAIRYGRMLGGLPYIRMVALTGSLAVLNVSKNADFDYMLVTKPGRVWTARAFAVLFNRIVRLFGHSVCPNLIVSETALEWPLHDLYSARELCQMIPITRTDVYQRLLKANGWAKEFLPNAYMDSGSLLPKSQKHTVGVQHLLELPIRGKFGDKFESWEMNRKIPRFSKQAGFGEETFFNAEVCQGNFHHHRKWTREVFENKLSALAAILSNTALEDQSPRTAIGANRL
jgi:hypothetical protein